MKTPFKGSKQIGRSFSISFKLLFRPVLYLTILLFAGAMGYHFLEGWSFFDSIYMTVITVTTVGFSEVHQLSNTGKMFTLGLIISGVFFYGIVINHIFKIFLEKRFQALMYEQKLFERINKLDNHFIICGGGRMAYAIGQELSRAGKKFIVIEMNPESPVSKAREREHVDWLVLERNALEEDSLREAKIEQAAGLFAVLTTDADNLFVVLSARQLNEKIYIETRISHESTRMKMHQAGANKVTSPYTSGGIQMARSMLQPNIDEFLEIFWGNSNLEFEMKMFDVVEGSEYEGMALKDTNFRKSGFIAIAIRHENGMLEFAPKSDLILQKGEQLVLLGQGKEFDIIQ